MQHLTFAASNRLPLPLLTAAVDRVPGHRTANMGYLDPDLVRATGLDPQANKSESIKYLD